MRSRSLRTVRNSAPLVIYDAEEDLSGTCCICFTGRPRLVSPCPCRMRYHQTCLLRYIRERLLSMKHELDLTQIRCAQCKQQIRFQYYEHTHYSCTYFCHKIRKNWCNKTLALIILIIIALVALGIILAGHSPGQGMIYYGLLIGESILCLLLLALLIVFVQANLTYKEITLVRVFDYVELQHNTGSSDDDQQHNIASETFEINIGEES